jgi:uracil-DNA glycosylase family 4
LPSCPQSEGIPQTLFDPSCRACPRLSGFLGEVARKYPHYHSAPVAPFGVRGSRLLVVGLAPGMHGANATGRPFTGDYAGLLLYRTLHQFAFASAAESVAADDGLQLLDCQITNAVKCLPPQNKPTGEEVRCCNRFLMAELGALPDNAVVIALGGIAHKAVLRALGLKQSAHGFAHGKEHGVQGLTLIDSYHCSRYNTQTRRLTSDMFAAVFARAREIIPV